jgi:hypothetical protein
MEFTIDPLTPDQVKQFIDIQYPFSAPEYRATMLREVMISTILQGLVCFPNYLVMLSGLYDDPVMCSYIEEGADENLSSLATMIKNEELTSEGLSKQWKKQGDHLIPRREGIAT